MAENFKRKYQEDKLLKGDTKSSDQVVMDPAVNYSNTAQDEISRKLNVSGAVKLTVGPYEPIDPAVNDLWLKTE